MKLINYDAPPSKGQAVLGHLIIQPVSNFCRKLQKLQMETDPTDLAVKTRASQCSTIEIREDKRIKKVRTGSNLIFFSYLALFLFPFTTIQALRQLIYF